MPYDASLPPRDPRQPRQRTLDRVGALGDHRASIDGWRTLRALRAT